MAQKPSEQELFHAMTESLPRFRCPCDRKPLDELRPRARRGCGEPGRVADTARVTLAPGSYQQLSGWSDDGVAAAVPAFVKSCGRMAAQQPDTAPLDPSAKDADFDRLEGLASAVPMLASKLPGGRRRGGAAIFEANFVPALVGSKGDVGLFTGYWEVELNGSAEGRPLPNPGLPPAKTAADLTGKPYLDRAAIETGALQGKEARKIAWLQSPDDLCWCCETQGSGLRWRIHLSDGGLRSRVVYDANNSTARPVSVYQLLAGSGRNSRPSSTKTRCVRGCATIPTRPPQSVAGTRGLTCSFQQASNGRWPGRF